MSSVDQGRIGPLTAGDGVIQPIRLTRDGSQAVQEAHARFQEAVLRGNVYYLSVGAATPTAYTGGAAGTPLLAIHNPSNNNKVAVLLAIGISNRAAASAAGVVGFDTWAGVSAQPTGTQTKPTNAFTQQAAGSSMLGFVNTALTGSTALGLVLPVTSYYWATAASAFLAGNMFLPEGLVSAIPGNEITIGATAALTSATWDITIFWEEVPHTAAGG